MLEYFIQMDKDDGLDVKCILYFIVCITVMVVLNLYLKEKGLLIGQKGEMLWVALVLFVF